MCRAVLFLLLLVFLTGCGRRHNGSIVNDTDETITVTLKLNYPYTDTNPDNYFRENIIDEIKVGSPEEAKTAADYIISYDSLTETAVLKLQPDDKVPLGTVRMGGPTRDKYQCWEFTEITCRGSKGYYMHASGPKIMDYVSKPFWSVNTYEFTIE